MMRRATVGGSSNASRRRTYRRMPNHSQKYLDVVPIMLKVRSPSSYRAKSSSQDVSFLHQRAASCEFPCPPSMGKISCMYRRSTGRPARASAATEAFSIMTNSIRFTKCSRVSCNRVRCSGAFDWKSKYRTCGARGVTKRIGGRRRAQMLRNVLDQSGGHYPAVGCMYRAWQIVSCDHSQDPSGLAGKDLVRDIIMHVLAWMWSSHSGCKTGNVPYADRIARPPFKANSLRIAASAVLTRYRNS